MNGNDPRLEIELSYGELSEGETRAGEICPSCKGGAAQEKSLSVSRRGGVLLFNCHRASCPFGGAIGASYSGGGKGRSSKSGTSPSYITTYPAVEATLKFLAGKFRVAVEDLKLAGLKWTGEGSGIYGRRVCYPIFGPDSRKRGESYRAYQGQEPKSIIFLRNPDDVVMSWYKWKRTSTKLVIVEDQMSAIKIAPFYHSVALLGTNLSETKIEEIVSNSNGYKEIHLCLDNDAVYKAIKLQLKWKTRLPNMRVTGIDNDVKNMDEDEFKSFLSRLEETSERK